MKQWIFFVGVLFFIVSCKSESEQVEDEGKGEVASSYADYFYPTDSLLPFIYVYQNVDQPLDEKVHRIYRLEEAKDTSLVVELYNSDLKITEAYTHNLSNGFIVEDHMIVGGDGKKRQAKLSSNTFFPMDKGEQTHFLSDFPSHLDSITMIYQSKRRIVEEKTTTVLGDEVPAIVLEDSVKIVFANPFTKESSAQKVKIMRTYAKGYGMVSWSANDGEIAYVLKRILPNSWWKAFAESPQIR